MRQIPPPLRRRGLEDSKPTPDFIGLPILPFLRPFLRCAKPLLIDREKRGIEDAIWLQVDDEPRVTPIADEDLDRETADKTSSVHFLRFELTPAMIGAWKRGAHVAMGVDHPDYNAGITLSPEQQRALGADFA